MISREFKEKISTGKLLLGTFVKLANPSVIETLGLLGLDFIIIDVEHAPCDQIQLENLIRAADNTKLPSIVRVPNSCESNIAKALDAGASGIQIPGLVSPESVEQALRYTKYAPTGHRGLSFSQRAAGYGLVDKTKYMQDSNKYLVNVVHIENREMAEQADILCDIEDIDVLFIGPMDLSQSYGHPGNPGHEDVCCAVDKILQICKVRNKTCGIFLGNADALGGYKNLGVSYFAIASDIGFLTDGARKILTAKQ